LNYNFLRIEIKLQHFIYHSQIYGEGKDIKNMRLRNVPGAREVMVANEFVFTEPEGMAGTWAEIHFDACADES
jgi:hypothetical protein